VLRYGYLFWRSSRAEDPDARVAACDGTSGAHVVSGTATERHAAGTPLRGATQAHGELHQATNARPLIGHKSPATRGCHKLRNRSRAGVLSGEWAVSGVCQDVGLMVKREGEEEMSHARAYPESTDHAPSKFFLPPGRRSATVGAILSWGWVREHPVPVLKIDPQATGSRVALIPGAFRILSSCSAARGTGPPVAAAPFSKNRGKEPTRTWHSSRVSPFAAITIGSTDRL